CLQGYSTPSSF
nr:immunoglobulin light chain junction region [Macaca mulatta]